MKLERGVVKWFHNAKGYGFIQRDDGSDVFIHYSAIQDKGYRSLLEGEVVYYEKRRGSKGFYATTVLPTRLLNTEQLRHLLPMDLECHALDLAEGFQAALFSCTQEINAAA